MPTCPSLWRRKGPRGGEVWLGAERPRSQELGSPSRISKVDLQAVGHVGGDRQRRREEGEREPGGGGQGGAGMSESQAQGSRRFSGHQTCQRKAGFGARQRLGCVCCSVFRWPVPSSKHPTERMCSLWQVLLHFHLEGGCGELGSRAAEPSHSQTRHPRSGSRKQPEVQTRSLAACRCLPAISGNSSKSALRCRTQRHALFPGRLTVVALSPSVGLGVRAAGGLTITQVLSR